MELDPKRYPIGLYIPPTDITAVDLSKWIQVIEDFPAALKAVVSNLPGTSLDNSYRENGWSARQLIFHLFDSHVNSYIRFKWTLTEDKPTIKAYDENGWTDIENFTNYSIPEALELIELFHKRWSLLLRSINEKNWNRKFIHPESGEKTLAENLGLYAWHCNHHLAHLKMIK